MPAIIQALDDLSVMDGTERAASARGLMTRIESAGFHSRGGKGGHSPPLASMSPPLARISHSPLIFISLIYIIEFN